MNVRVRSLVPCLLLLAPLFVDAAPPRGGKAVSVRKPVAEDVTEAPPHERERRNPVPATPDAIRAARLQWREHCETCHGAQGRGDGPNARLHEARKGAAPRNLTEPDVQENLTDGEIFWRISHGLIEGDNIIMPAFGTKIPSETHRWQLVLLVREMGRLGPPR